MSAATDALAAALAGGDRVAVAEKGTMAEAAWARAAMAEIGWDVAALPAGGPVPDAKPDPVGVEALAVALADYRRRAKEPEARDRWDAAAAAERLAGLGAALARVPA